MLEKLTKSQHDALSEAVNLLSDVHQVLLYDVFEEENNKLLDDLKRIEEKLEKAWENATETEEEEDDDE